MTRRSVGVGIIAACFVAVIGLAATAVVINLKVLAASSTPAPATTTTASAGPPNTLTVVGQGNAQATPDSANLSLGASSTRPTVQAALDANNGDMQNLLKALHNQSVVDKDIQTASVAVTEVTSGCCPGTVTGYDASDSVTVTIHHLQNVGAVIAAAVSAVGNDVTIGGVSLFVGDQSAALSTARTAAMADAGVRATQWATLVHRSLGKILSVSEVLVGGGQNQSTCNQGCGGASGVPIEAGQTTITVSVTVTYELQT